MNIVKINLENEMDLMIAYKRSMKLAELCGLSTLLQTSFATAVSEIARCAIKDKRDKPYLNLEIKLSGPKKKDLVASVFTRGNFQRDYPDALKYATRLSEDVSITKQGDVNVISFVQPINFSGLLNEAKLESFVHYFKTEAPISAYDEIRKKNILLLEVSEKLRTSENKYRDLTRTLPLMVFTTTAPGNLNYVNRWFMDSFKLADIQQDKMSWTGFIHPSDMKRVRAEWDKAQVAQTTFTTQAKLRVKDSNDFLWHLVSLTPVKNEENQTVSWTGFFVDIHSQKLVEETLKDNKELKHAQKQLLKSQNTLEEKVFELNKSNHDLEQFAYIASHDLQEPLRKIRTFTSLVKKNIHTPEQATDYVAKIEASCTRMTTLIKDVLNYSRLIKTDNIFVDTDLNEVFNQVLNDMDLVIMEKKASVTAAGLRTIHAVPQQVQQLFYNLISNALKFNDGEPVISIKARELTAAEVKRIPELHSGLKYLEMEVKDNGIGFEASYANQVFTIFKRLHPREAYAGTGIGLALCKKIVDNHHGRISAKSEPGKGAEFCIVLPIE